MLDASTWVICFIYLFYLFIFVVYFIFLFFVVDQSCDWSSSKIIMDAYRQFNLNQKPKLLAIVAWRLCHVDTYCAPRHLPGLLRMRAQLFCRFVNLLLTIVLCIILLLIVTGVLSSTFRSIDYRYYNYYRGPVS